MAEFRVVIEGLELDDETTVMINNSIQKAVLDHLADIDITTREPRGLVAFRPRPEWRGLVVDIVAQKDLGTLPNFGKLSDGL